MMIKVIRFAGSEIARYIRDLAQLRMEVFQEFPYLYAGTLAYEEAYLANYLTTPDSVMVIAFDDSAVVGASTGLPLVDADPEFQTPFRAHGYDLDSIFYFGESVLQRSYRGQGIGGRFFDEREGHVRGLGRFQTICFCAVERVVDHPRRPAHYRPLDTFWQRRGYVKHPELSTTYYWRDLDEEEESPKPMSFWLKQPIATGDTPSQAKGVTGHKG